MTHAASPQGWRARRELSIRSRWSRGSLAALSAPEPNSARHEGKSLLPDGGHIG
ncbi:hypothetical protein WQQ_05880 [Hydrocarboniphaga effusa AP103]|uniref:Uncharacterized protein n=1 Tax=Hydrocarboniphaga effusa AP103 TaxID=1172194 RepID=I8I396_9GAMM|nr:hypothetical protein WQQ_05880 [Hydrocarboniphaga effusa AP103]